MVVTSQTIALQLDQVAHSNKDAVKTAAMSATVAATTTHAMRTHAQGGDKVDKRHGGQC